jgi:dTDP-4-dehydrorhamnose 3,5-epimerase
MDFNKQLNGMKITETNLKDAFVITSKKYEDDRGFFMESFNAKDFRENVSRTEFFVQDNHSKSSKGVLRGLHYQIKHPQAKLVRCISGVVYDVIVDLRKTSETFGKWFGITLDRPELQLWVPPGFAHGFYVVSDLAEIVYKTTDYYYPEHDRTLLWNDSELNIDWGFEGNPVLSLKDSQGKTFEECDKYEYE